MIHGVKEQMRALAYGPVACTFLLVLPCCASRAGDADGGISDDADVDDHDIRDAAPDAVDDADLWVAEDADLDFDDDVHQDGDLDEPRPLVFPADDWETISPAEAGMDAELLNTGLAALPGNIVVVRYGYIVATHGDPTESLALYSVGKSLTALVFGTLLQAGLVTLDDTVPGSDYPTAPQASFRQFLSMTSDYGLTPHAPGEHYAYNNAAVQYYGEHLSATYFDDGSPDAIFDEQIFAVIGRQDSLSFTGWWSGWDGGFIASARDMARVGLLVLGRGNWNGSQVAPSSFIDELYASQIPPDATMNTSTGMDTGTNNRWNQQQISARMQGNYSFGFWTNASSEQPDLPTEVAHASGFRGNRIIVCPPEQLVIAVTHDGESGTYPDWDAYLRAVVASMDGEIEAPTVTRLVLVDADRDVDIGPLGDGDILDLSTLPTTSLNVRAETSPSSVGSVRFSLDGAGDYQTENVAPYTLAGDEDGDYTPWTPSVGEHNLGATAFTGQDGTGIAGDPLTVRFSVL